MALPTCRIRDANLDVRPDLGCLKRPDGEEVYLRPKTFQTLLLLLEQRHRVVTKDEIAAGVWPDTAVTDDAVVQCIVEIRRVLGDDAKQARFIRTLPKSGYRFVGEVDLAVPPLPFAHSRPAQPPQPYRGISHRSSLRSLSVVALVSVVLLSAIGALANYVRSSSTADAGLPLSLSLDDGRDRPKVAVMFLENQSRTAELDWLREGLADMLVTGLSRSRAVSVVGRQHLELLLDRVGHARGSNIDLAKAVDIAQRARLDHIVAGGYAKLGNTIRVDLRLHDRNGRLVKTEALTIDAPDDLLKQIDLLSWRVAQHFGELAPVAPSPSTTLTRNLEAYRYYSLGVSQANHYHSVEAVDLLTKATELDPEFAMAYGRIGYAYGVTWSQTDRARPYLAKAYQLAHRLSEQDRLQVEAWNALVHLDYQSAAATLTQLIRAYPLEVEPYVRLGVILAGERKYDQAIQTLHRGLAADPESTDLWNRLGGVYGEAGRHTEAIAAHQKYVTLRPNEANAYDSLGLSFVGAGKYAEAVAGFRKAIALNPGFAVAWIHLGNAYVHTGQYAKAEAAYRQYVTTSASDAERRRGHTALAVLAQKRGRIAEAADLMKQARPVLPFGLDAPIRIEAGEPPASVAASLRQPIDTPNRGSRLGDRVFRHAQGVVALKRGANDEALEHFRAANAERPVMWQADWLEDSLANACLQLGHYDEAIAEYERILRLYPRYPLIYYRLGLALEGKSQPALARKAYENFLNNWATADPDVPEVVRARARLAAFR